MVDDTLANLTKKLRTVTAERDEALGYLKATAGIVDILKADIAALTSRVGALEAMPHNKWRPANAD